MKLFKMLRFGFFLGYLNGLWKKQKLKNNMSTDSNFCSNYNFRFWAGQLVPSEVWEVLNEQWTINHPGEPTPLNYYDEFLVYLRENKTGIYQPRFTSNKTTKPTSI